MYFNGISTFDGAETASICYLYWEYLNVILNKFIFKGNNVHNVQEKALFCISKLK